MVESRDQLKTELARVSGIGSARPNPGSRPPARSRSSFPFVLMISALVHAGLAAGLISAATHRDMGGGATELEAVTVTIISASELTPADGASSAGQAPRHDTAPDMAEPSADSAAAPAEAVEKPVKEQETPEPARQSPEAATADVMPPPKEDSRETEPPPVKPPDETAAQPAPAAAQQPPVSASSAQIAIGGERQGDASASPGAIAAYARDVALVLARSKPKGVGLRGRLLVEFKLSPDDGALLASNVVQSSGTPRLDALALAAIAKGKYPRPPTGMTAAQLTYRVPFAFE